MAETGLLGTAFMAHRAPGTGATTMAGPPITPEIEKGTTEGMTNAEDNSPASFSYIIESNHRLKICTKPDEPTPTNGEKLWKRTGPIR